MRVMKKWTMRILMRMQMVVTRLLASLALKLPIEQSWIFLVHMWKNSISVFSLKPWKWTMQLTALVELSFQPSMINLAWYLLLHPVGESFNSWSGGLQAPCLLNLFFASTNKTIKNKSKWQDHALVHAINSHFKELKLHSEDKIAGKIIFKAPFELEPQTSPELLMHRDADGSKVGHVTTIQHYDQLKKLQRMKKMMAPRKDREYTRQTIRSFIFVAKKRSDGFNESKNVREADSSNKIKKPDKKPQAPEAKKRSRPSSPSTALTATTSSISARSPSPV